MYMHVVFVSCCCFFLLLFLLCFYVFLCFLFCLAGILYAGVCYFIFIYLYIWSNLSSSLVFSCVFIDTEYMYLPNIWRCQINPFFSWLKFYKNENYNYNFFLLFYSLFIIVDKRNRNVYHNRMLSTCGHISP
jgi:hypothetical protein